MSHMVLKLFPKQQILGPSKLKELAKDYFEFNENGGSSAYG